MKPKTPQVAPKVSPTPLRAILAKHREYQGMLLQALKARKRLMVPACGLCFMLGILAGMWVTQQHYESASSMGPVQMEPVVEDEPVVEPPAPHYST